LDRAAVYPKLIEFFQVIPNSTSDFIANARVASAVCHGIMGVRSLGFESSPRLAAAED
jgi:hypothetical protein